MVLSAMARDDRTRISSLGEWYDDLLAIDALINGRSQAQQAASLLCSKLQEREEKIKQRVRYLAAKRGIPVDQMWLQLLKGDYRKLSDEELATLDNLDNF
jgi:uncharacterized protein (DUF3084 family)